MNTRQQQSRQRRLRRGTSLVEVMVTMSVGSVVFLTVIAVFHQTFRLGTQQQRRMSDAATIDALSRIWRVDLSDASDVTLGDGTTKDQTSLTLIDSAGQSVEYTVDRNAVRRQSEQGTQVFRLSSFYEFALTEDPGQAHLHVRCRPIETDETTVEFRIWTVTTS